MVLPKTIILLSENAHAHIITAAMIGHRRTHIDGQICGGGSRDDSLTPVTVDLTG
jgi:hypothetical protein